MNNENIFINANKASAEGDYDECITYCAENIKWKMLVKANFMVRSNYLDVYGQLMMD